MKMPEYELYCPVCGRFINPDERIYNVDDEWICKDCMMDTVNDDYELLERYDYDADSIAEEMEYEDCIAQNKHDEAYCNLIDYLIDEIKDENY